MRIALCVLSILLVTYSRSTAQTSYYWNFGTSIGSNALPTTGSNPNLTVSAFSIGNNNGPVTALSQASASSGYTGASGSYNIGNAARTGGLNTGASGSAFFRFTVTPTGGFPGIELTGLSFGTRSASTGPQSITLRSSVDNYATDVITPITVANNSTWTLQTATIATSQFSLGGGNPIEFRIYGSDGNGTADASVINWRLDDVTVTLTPVPEPACLLAVGAVAFGLATRRRSPSLSVTGLC